MAGHATLRAHSAVPNGSADWCSECARRVRNSAANRQMRARLPMRAAAAGGVVALSAPQSFAYRCVSMLGNLIAAKVATECMLEEEEVALWQHAPSRRACRAIPAASPARIHRSARYIGANAYGLYDLVCARGCNATQPTQSAAH